MPSGLLTQTITESNRPYDTNHNGRGGRAPWWRRTIPDSGKFPGAPSLLPSRSNTALPLQTPTPTAATTPTNFGKYSNKRLLSPRNGVWLTKGGPRVLETKFQVEMMTRRNPYGRTFQSDGASVTRWLRLPALDEKIYVATRASGVLGVSCLIHANFTHKMGPP